MTKGPHSPHTASRYAWHWSADQPLSPPRKRREKQHPGLVHHRLTSTEMMLIMFDTFLWTCIYICKLLICTLTSKPPQLMKRKKENEHCARPKLKSVDIFWTPAVATDCILSCPLQSITALPSSSVMYFIQAKKCKHFRLSLKSKYSK